jgi:hypothetical protein
MKAGKLQGAGRTNKLTKLLHEQEFPSQSYKVERTVNAHEES